MCTTCQNAGCGPGSERDCAIRARASKTEGGTRRRRRTAAPRDAPSRVPCAARLVDATCDDHRRWGRRRATSRGGRWAAGHLAHPRLRLSYHAQMHSLTESKRADESAGNGSPSDKKRTPGFCEPRLHALSHGQRCTLSSWALTSGGLPNFNALPCPGARWTPSRGPDAEISGAAAPKTPCLSETVHEQVGGATAALGRPRRARGRCALENAHPRSDAFGPSVAMPLAPGLASPRLCLQRFAPVVSTAPALPSFRPASYRLLGRSVPDLAWRAPNLWLMRLNLGRCRPDLGGFRPNLRCLDRPAFVCVRPDLRWQGPAVGRFGQIWGAFD